MFPPVLNEVFLSLGLLRGISSENVPAWNCWLIQTDVKMIVSQLPMLYHFLLIVFISNFLQSRILFLNAFFQALCIIFQFLQQSFIGSCQNLCS